MGEAYVNSNGILKSFSDTREYRLIKLDNGIRAVLVSDVENLVDLTNKPEITDTVENEINDSEDASDEEDDSEDAVGAKGEKLAACAVCVNVGSFSDPLEIQGLAHFVEHMIFMGSEKFPKENALDEFLAKRGGSDNGVTECEYTTFHIECPEEFLQEGMDIFSQFFTTPLMLKDAMTREREAIDAEFELALPSDGTRAEQILGALAPANHPARKFAWGNLVTLRDRVSDEDLHNAGRKFWERYYSSEFMTIAVVARLSLDTLENFVRSSFCNVPKNGLPPPEFSQFKGAYGQDGFHKLIWMKPVHDKCEITLSWILPPLDEHYKSRPLAYLSSIVGHEGKGSLISFLRKRLWCLNCTAGCDGTGFENNSIYSVFTIILDATEEGLANIDKVIFAVFQYLGVIIEAVPDKRFFDELKSANDAKFKYQFEADAATYAEFLSMALHRKEPKDIAHSMFLEYNPEAIKEISTKCDWNGVNIMVQCRQKPDEFYDLEEPWFKTKYRIEEIPSAWSEMCKNPPLSSEFHLPPPNAYITSRFSLHDSNVVQHPAYPEKVLETDILEVWYRQDRKFMRPMAIFNIYLQSPLAKAHPRNLLLSKMLTELIQQKLKEDFYCALEAGYNWTCGVGDFGFTLHFAGYDEKLPLLYEEVLKSIRHLCDTLTEPDNVGLFAAIKTDLSRDIYNTFIEPSDLNKTLRLSLLLDVYWTPMEVLAEIESVDLPQLDAFCRDFFSAVHAKMLLQGNITLDTALEVAQKLPAIFQLSPLNKKPTMSVWNIPANSELCCRVPSFNNQDNNAVITNYYQSGPSTAFIRTSCIIELIMMLLQTPLFDKLRTNQQLGYDVSAEIRDTFGILGFSTTVHYQSTKFTPDEVDARLGAFMHEFATDLKTISDEELQTTKEGLIALKRHEDLNLSEEVTRNFAEITSGEYKFDRLPQEVEMIPNLTREELSSWFEAHVTPTESFKKLSVQVHGVGQNDSSKDISSGQYLLKPFFSKDDNKFIGNILEFKKNRQFYPTQMPS